MLPLGLETSSGSGTNRLKTSQIEAASTRPPVELQTPYLSKIVGDSVEIRPFQESDLDTIVELSMRAWDPVFTSLRAVLGDPVFLRLKPDWKEAQADEVRTSCTSDERDAFVAVADGRPVGFVTVALNAFNEGMGVIEIIGVDPDFQRRGIGSRLTRHALEHMRRCGMDIAAVETGGDPGHAPARAAYEALGFTLLPSARYLKLLDE
jgi:ribosomal protein S18 acetylase RimI-like enzyme